MKHGLAIVVLLSLCLTAFALDDQDKELLNKAADSYDRLFTKTFSVNMASPEIAQFLQTAVANASKQMGFPVIINIKHFVFSAKDGRFSTKAVLNVPDEQMRQMMEQQANQLLESSGMAQALADMTLGALAKASGFLKNHDQLNMEKSDQAVALFSVKAPTEKLIGNLEMTKGLFKVSKDSCVIPEFRFDFSDGSAVWVQLRHDAVTPTGQGDAIQCPVMMIVSQTLKLAPGGQPIPQRITLAYSNYQFE